MATIDELTQILSNTYPASGSGIPSLINALNMNLLSRPRVVGTYGKAPLALLATNATMTTYESRHFFYVGVDSPWLQITFDNWCISAAGAEQAAPTALTIASCALESDALVVSHPLYFSGSRGVTINANATQFTDVIYATQFGLPVFKRGTKYWVRVRGSVPANTGQVPQDGRNYNPPGCYASRFNPSTGSNGTSQVDGTGILTAKTGEDSFGSPVCYTAVIGIGLDPSIPSWVSIGDSIGDQAVETASVAYNTGQAAESGPAFINRAMFTQGNPNPGVAPTQPCPILNFNRASTTVASTISGFTNRQNYLPFVTDAIEEGGTNDIGTPGPGLPLVVEGSITTLWGILRAAGIRKIVRTWIMPRNLASTDGWTSYAGQTDLPGFDSSEDTLNQFFNAQMGLGVIDAVDPTQSIRDPAHPHAWLTLNGTAYTAEGTHPNTLGSILAAVELRSYLTKLYPGMGT